MKTDLDRGALLLGALILGLSAIFTAYGGHEQTAQQDTLSCSAPAECKR